MALMHMFTPASDEAQPPTKKYDEAVRVGNSIIISTPVRHDGSGVRQVSEACPQCKQAGPRQPIDACRQGTSAISSDGTSSSSLQYYTISTLAQPPPMLVIHTLYILHVYWRQAEENGAASRDKQWPKPHLLDFS